MEFNGFLSGISDEAAKDIDRQIAAHQELGWDTIELRNIDGTNLTELPDEQFDAVCQKLERAGLQVSCFASQLANWSRPIAGDFEVDVQELARAIPRMQTLGTPFIRCMSYPNADPPWEERRWRAEAIRRMKTLTDMAEKGGVTLVHENCSGWGGLGPAQTMELLLAVKSPSLKLVFDTGNPIEYGQSSWHYYEGVREEIVYIHIKDYHPPKKDGVAKACYPGEGIGDVEKILRDLLSRGYRGGISIEPHIASVVHLGQEIEDPELSFTGYVEYGRRLERLIASL